MRSPTRSSNNVADMNFDEIYVVEDNKTMRLGMVESLRRAEYCVFAFENAVDALKSFAKRPVPLVVTDLKMEPMDGLELMRKIKENTPHTEVIMVSAYGTVEKAVEAMQIGAADFITKPFSPEELRIRVRKVMEKMDQSRAMNLLREENLLLQGDLFAEYESMIGNSPAMRNVFELIDRVARGDSTVLIEGESGTGKELVARAIHRKSPRSDKPFLKLNCASLNENLLESELFGHEKGAFTGAIKQKKGRFELAHGGTFFLDEIGDIPPSLQVKLLRVLQEMEFERVGGEQTISVDVRLIFATHRNLQRLIENGQFREDLFYRLSVFPVKLPALRQRREDIPTLVEHFLAKLAQKRNEPARTISSEGMNLLKDYSWPGNVRELENLMERLAVICADSEIRPSLIAQHLGGVRKASPDHEDYPLDETLYSFEKNMIQAALKRANGVKNRAAKLLGIKTSTLYYKMEKFGLID
ncbi:MAG: sigma-54 dependent transcriptional regulator [bacterium]